MKHVSDSHGDFKFHNFVGEVLKKIVEKIINLDGVV